MVLTPYYSSKIVGLAIQSLFDRLRDTSSKTGSEHGSEGIVYSNHTTVMDARYESLPSSLQHTTCYRSMSYPASEVCILCSWGDVLRYIVLASVYPNRVGILSRPRGGDTVALKTRRDIVQPQLTWQSGYTRNEPTRHTQRIIGPMP